LGLRLDKLIPCKRRFQGGGQWWFLRSLASLGNLTLLVLHLLGSWIPSSIILQSTLHMHKLHQHLAPTKSLRTHYYRISYCNTIITVGYVITDGETISLLDGWTVGCGDLLKQRLSPLGNHWIQRWSSCFVLSLDYMPSQLR
jgi:hypothetical protein